MRAVQVIEPTGPDGVRVVDVDAPDRDALGPTDVLIDVEWVGISFPDLLLSKGEYQLKPEPPFTLGVDFAGTVIAGPQGEGAQGYAEGDRVAGVLPHGG